MAADRPWAALTAREKTSRRFAGWLDPGFPFVTPAAKAAYRARVTRLTTAMRLEGIPDRVPIRLAVAEGYPAYRAGLTPYDAMYDFDRVAPAPMLTSTSASSQTPWCRHWGRPCPAARSS